MPRSPLFDISNVDLDRVIVSREEIYAELPHRHEFMLLDRIVHVNHDECETVAVREVGDAEFWVRGHIPGRPILPGVMMVETAAQLASFVTTRFLNLFDGRFLGMGGLDNVKFRGEVGPNCRVILLCKLMKAKSRQVLCASQAYLGDKLVFEGEITGIPI
jgi:3-hydroxyacyl-[acyl-carrier-protein] dehydratase